MIKKTMIYRNRNSNANLSGCENDRILNYQNCRKD